MERHRLCPSSSEARRVARVRVNGQGEVSLRQDRDNWMISVVGLESRRDDVMETLKEEDINTCVRSCGALDHAAMT